LQLRWASSIHFHHLEAMDFATCLTK